MRRLEKLVLVQFSLFDAVEIVINRNTGFLGANGSCKTTLLDAIQVAMLGAHGTYVAFNTQKAGGPRDRTLRDYCLGVTSSGGDERVLTRKRQAAESFISLVFRDSDTGVPLTVGVNLAASSNEIAHDVLGWYLFPGVALTLDDHLEGKVEAEQVPLRWADFAAVGRARCAKANAVALFPPRPERYIDELLHALQSRQKAINTKEFLKAFKKSLTLRDIDSVNDFVRDFIVESVPLNRERATAQIKEFNRLKQLVERVRQQIADLKVINGHYERVNREERRIATLAALKVSYEREHFARQVATQTETRDREMGAYVEASDRVTALNGQIELAVQNTERAQSALTNAPGAGRYQHAQELLQTHEENRKEARDNLAGELSKLASAIHELHRTRVLPAEQTALHPLDQGLAAAATALDNDGVEGLAVLLEQALQVLVRCGTALAAALKKAQDDEDRISQETRAAVAREQQARKGGAPTSDPTNIVIDALREAGIEATPICDLVKVVEPEWQRAVEAFLGRNRESLVVEPGKERQAVALLRKMPERANVWGVTIVQPAHLAQESWSDPENKLVGSLLSGESVAVAYLRLLLGKMRRVETEAELERYARSLTVDGMLSANGGTRRLRLLAANELLLGRRSTEEDVNRLRREAEAVGRRYQEARDRVTLLELAQGKLNRAAGVELSRVSHQINRVAQGTLAIDRQRLELNALDSNDLVPLREEVNRCKEVEKGLRAELAEAQKSVGGAGKAIEEAERQLDMLNPLLEAGQRDERAARARPDFDEDLEARTRADIDQGAPGAPQRTLVERAKECERRAGAASTRQAGFRDDAASNLQEYLTKHNVVLDEERRDWRKAWAWVRETCATLEGSELVQYAAEAEEARKKADQAFRTDISVKMREGIGHMRDVLDQLNRQLKACPPFSNGERYRFEAKPAEAHKSIYDYIMRTDADDLLGTDTEAANAEAHQKILQWLDLAGTGTGGSNPLEDYRVLFTFDVLIEHDGIVVTKLSKRLGTGSGGEYRAPYYVIAGAALAAAYRIDPNAPVGGAALMLLDEAFAGMDHQNAVAAARFLNGLGLQLIMAAPDTDLAKLAPVTDTLYELMRSEFDVFLDAIEIKEAGKVLFLSDMPSEHPDLLTSAVAALNQPSAVAGPA